MENQYSIRIGNTNFIVSVKPSETAKKPMDTAFRGLCVHEVLGDCFASDGSIQRKSKNPLDKPAPDGSNKTGIFEKTKQGQVDADAAAQEKFPSAASGAKPFHKPPVCIIKRCGEEHQKNIQGFSPGVEGQAENKQSPIFP